MDILLYFVIGALNICLLILLCNIYRRISGVDLFPGRVNNDKMEMFLCIVVFILTGHFGTIAILFMGVFLFLLWMIFYRKK